MSDVQSEVISKLSELSAQIRELVIELRHTQQQHQTHEGRLAKVEESVRALQLDSAMNKPILDIARQINTKMIITIVTAVIAVAGMNVDWSKFVGG